MCNSPGGEAYARRRRLRSFEWCCSAETLLKLEDRVEETEDNGVKGSAGLKPFSTEDEAVEDGVSTTGPSHPPSDSHLLARSVLFSGDVKRCSIRATSVGDVDCVRCVGGLATVGPQRMLTSSP